MAIHVAMGAICCHFTRLSDRDIMCIWLQWYLLHICFVSQHCCSTSVISNQIIDILHYLNRTCTVSYGIYGAHVVIYIPVLAITEDIALSLGLVKLVI